MARSEKAVDQAVLKLVPVLDEHVTFRTLVRRFREASDWELSQNEGDALVHESLKRLEKAGRVMFKTYPDMPLCYSQPPKKGT